MTRITKATWEKLHGPRNPHLYRKQGANGRWTYHVADPAAWDYVPSAPDALRSDGSRPFVIFDRMQGLFWSNAFGWTGLGTADRFTLDEMRKVRPPMGAIEWIAESDARILVSQGVDDAR